MTIYTRADVVKMIRDIIKRLGSMKIAANAMCIVPEYLSIIIHGGRNPGPAILEYFGLRKESKGVYVSALGDGKPLEAEFEWQEFNAPPIKSTYGLKPIHKRDLMKRLGSDYVQAKLAGMIKMPKGRGKQISLD